MQGFQRLIFVAGFAAFSLASTSRATALVGLSLACACRSVPASEEIALSGDKHEIGLSREYYTVQTFQEGGWNLVVTDKGTVAAPVNQSAVVWVQDTASKVTAYTVFKGGQVVMSGDFIVLRKEANPAPFVMNAREEDATLTQGQQVVHCRTKASIRGWTLTGDCWGTPATNPATGCQETACGTGNGHCTLTVYNTDGTGGSTNTDCGTAGAKFIECTNSICWTFGVFIP